jgi:ABC-type dipeptide/oligopeptide/nickel transport system ATPase component
MNSFIQLSEVHKQFVVKKQTFEALCDVNLSIEEGQFVSIVGPSGCGKSTILRILAGLEDVSTGDVIVDGADVIGPGADRGMVFQTYTLFPWLSVRENIQFGLKLKGIPLTIRRRMADRFLELIKLEKFTNAYPHQLSGGMKQRVAIARALAANPKVLLMDEPFGALDAQTKMDMQEMLRDIWQTEQTTVVFITHDIDEAIYLSQRVVLMAANPGRIIAQYEVDLPEERDLLTRELPQFLKLKRELIQRLKHE